MIDDKYLDEVSKMLGCLIPKEGVAAPSSHEFGYRVCDCVTLELIRLARLGLWAEKYGLPALLVIEDLARFHIDTFMSVPMQFGAQPLRDWGSITTAIRKYEDVLKEIKK